MNWINSWIYTDHSETIWHFLPWPQTYYQNLYLLVLGRSIRSGVCASRGWHPEGHRWSYLRVRRHRGRQDAHHDRPHVQSSQPPLHVYRRQRPTRRIRGKRYRFLLGRSVWSVVCASRVSTCPELLSLRWTISRPSPWVTLWKLSSVHDYQFAYDATRACKMQTMTA